MYSNQLKTFILVRWVLLSFFLLFFGREASALPAHEYAVSSRLASGNWIKIEVEKDGMQFVDNATLRSFGFPQPEKVNVFGYGGIVIPETLSSPDDLPLVPSLKTDDGIFFFGKGSTGWLLNTSGETLYSHLSHPYSDKSFYFLSDCMEENVSPSPRIPVESSGNIIDTFTERLVHEQDLFMPMTSGRLILGEDFKSNSSRSFRFQLPGNTGDALVTASFGCKTSSGISSLVFTANGKQLGATTADRLAASDTKLITTTKTTKEVQNAGADLELNIKFNGTGNVSVAALDYIEIEYPRRLEIIDGELFFYLNSSESCEVKLTGANSSTKLWDVTDHVNPQEIEFRLEGNIISFFYGGGYREFIAFDPSVLSNKVLKGEKIVNQDIHALASPDMLVIAPEEYLPAANRLASLHKETDRLTVTVLTPEEIYNEFSGGTPDVSAFRKLLKMWYDRAEGIEGNFPGYCLIMSRPTYDNKMVTSQVRNCGYPRIPIWQSPTGETENTSFSTDDYIGMLKDVEGNFDIGNAEINVAVARMPVKSLKEAEAMIDKLESYLKNPNLGAWRNNVMVIADDQDKGVHLQQAEAVIEAMKSQPKGKDVIYEKLYLDAYPLEYSGTGPAYPQAHKRMMEKWNEGVSLINYIGHANTKSWGHESLLSWTDLNNMTNTKLPFIYAATCEFMRWDADDLSGAEVLWLHPSCGVIGMISPSREVIISANGTLNQATSKYFYKKKDNGEQLTVGEIMVKGKNDSKTGNNKLRYGLIGDPTLRLPIPSLDVRVDSINGVDLNHVEDPPVIAARSSVKLKGHIESADATMIEDFNGIMEISLYDAEKAITTNGNGPEGVESTYNDRKIILYKGLAKVSGGEWSAQFMMPSEIENNFSPALLSFYAHDENGREASGTNEEFYVYGYDTEAPEDFEGPRFIEFYLNSAGFKNGNEVAPNPTLYARFYDESGISVSEAGIAHNLSLEIDGKVISENISQFYDPDPEDSNYGSVSVPLGDIGFGKHSLSLKVWDNAGNSSDASLEFSISALWKPTIETLYTDVNPATSTVNFIIGTDGTTNAMECEVEVYDLNGRRVWKEKAPALMSGYNKTTINWDLSDAGGGRVPQGFYVYKATVTTGSGVKVDKSNKLIVR